MVGKRKAADLIARVTKIAKEEEESKKKSEEEQNPLVEEGGKRLNEEEEYAKEVEEMLGLGQTADETKEEYVTRIEQTTSKSDKVFEYLFFRRSLPSMISEEEKKLIEEVEDELGVNLADATMINPQTSKRGSSTPLLDAIGYKNGKNYMNILAPPVTKCVLCHRDLTKNHNASQVVRLTLEGPVVATKYIWRCRNCPQFINGDIAFHPDKYGNPVTGYKFYAENLGVSVEEGSSEVYFDSLLVKSHMAELQHGWMSAIAKAESYNETFLETAKVESFKLFLKYNPQVGVHFKKKSKGAENELEDEDLNKMFEMKRKSLSTVLVRSEIKREVIERGLDLILGPKEQNGKNISYKDSVNEFMVQVDELRRTEVYPHENCSKACADRGCKWVLAVDGLWKLRFKICMWNTEHSYPTEITDYLPNACPNAPADAQAFCTEHCEIVKKLNKPTKLTDFINVCGADPKAMTKEGQSKMRTVLASMAKDAAKLEKGNHAKNGFSDAQGTSYLLRNKAIANQTNMKPDKNEEDCRKDTGEKGIHKHSRSRGVFMSVSGGGIIRNWAPLFKSEGAAQVGLLTTSFLHSYLKSEIPNPVEWSNFSLSYDNMCHIDELKLLNKPLSLPAPFDKMWGSINKVIDPLHIRNHTREKCQQLYSPKSVTSKYPEANMMQCEQTFAWLGRYKKILNSTPKTTFQFLLHRLVVGRNSYTERCYKDGKRPLLPAAKVFKDQ